VFNNWTRPLDELHRFVEGADAWSPLTIDNDTKTAFHRCVAQ
jgi:hypothetical protein